MAYIGKIPATGAFQKCDALSASTTADYTLQVGSTNVVPESVNHMIVSLNGVIQSPTTAFTVSGSTLSFASALIANDTIDFVILLGNVLDIGVPSDATITNAKLASDLISGETDIGAAIVDADLFLLDDGAGGTLRKSAASRIKTYVGGGKVLQVVQGTTSTETRNSTSTLADTTLTAAITPSATSSKILVTVMQNGCDKSAADAGNHMILKLLRGASVISVFGNNVGYTNSTVTNSFGTTGTMYLDSPSSTSELTYKTQLANGNNTAAVGVQGTGGEASTITLMEIAA